ncbi:CHAT domain-containing protein [Streptomyces sp. NBC_01483]|uniref:CHAT domain-containing protein n=1 Tax=Streptomyces sp. NBC_01483 TaxID=2903883 RepID=UPI002E325090|nr:CHAT domain-containing protein [Streptomyces sp. NBC_01483]
MPPEDERARTRRYITQLNRSNRQAAAVRRPPYRRRPAPAVPHGAAGEARALPALTMDLGRRLPVGMAVLLVLPVRRGHGPGFRLRGVCCCGLPQDFSEYSRPDIALASLVARGGIPPTKVVATMRRWSQNKPDLTRWLHGRRCEHGDDLELVIWDETGYGIPWELFWLDAPPRSPHRAGWLGGLITLTRWLTVNAAWSVVREYAEPHTCAGPVAAYIAEDMRNDDRLLHAYASEGIAGVRGLPKALAAGAPLGMVYVACHGTFGSGEDDCLLGDVPLVMLEGGNSFERLASAATFVFLNACHSGQLLADEGEYADQTQRGFSELFLRSGAAGVLATSGAIGDEEAHQMADELLQLLSARPHTPIAVALRELRSTVAHLTPADLLDVEGKEEQRRLLPLLYRFMYVYYGSPRTVVTLTAREAST